MVRITALMDNQPSENKALTAQHGLSLLIEKDGKKILFDCGQGEETLRNAHRLGCDISAPDAVVLSHSHYDHAAGFRDYTEQIGGCRILYTGPGFFEPKFAFDGVKYTDLSAGFDEKFLKEHGIRHETVSDHSEILPGIFVFADFQRTHAFERIPERFVKLTQGGFVRDDFSDEVCIALDFHDKVCVLVGCAHPGILNMLERVRQAMGKPVYAVFGGTHLCEADGDRIDRTVSCMKEMGLRIAGFSHCSGVCAEEKLRGDSGMMSCRLGAGDCIFL